ncbi:MAG: Gfo/Idh/MocA family oxidoreductase [Chitinophagaceae bacterium]|nr:Gfo/Idh/MocA family oxidoreductase [Chitinophagaceae bacterium]
MGCGFWARYQIPAWLELDGVELVAVYNRTLEQARQVADLYNVPGCYDNAEELFKQEQLDFVDIITDVSTHVQFVKMAALYKVPVICQKPMASCYDQAFEMLRTCRQAGIPLFIHENFRWQAPFRQLKEILNSGIVGKVFKARISFCSAFPVFENQPFLKELKEFIITDIGSHVLDVSRFLFGETETLYAQALAVNPDIKGEDVANIFLRMESGVHCFVEMSYASILEIESFPQTLLLIEGSKGSVSLNHDSRISITTKAGTLSHVVSPELYEWADPAYAVVHSSIVDCCRNILGALLGSYKAETTADDNFKTVSLVWAAYASCKNNEVIDMKKFTLVQA